MQLALLCRGPHFAFLVPLAFLLSYQAGYQFVQPPLEPQMLGVRVLHINSRGVVESPELRRSQPSARGHIAGAGHPVEVTQPRSETTSKEPQSADGHAPPAPQPRSEATGEEPEVLPNPVATLPSILTRRGNSVPKAPSVEITIVAFAEFDSLDFAINWLFQLRNAIGTRYMQRGLLVYCDDEKTEDALLETGLVARRTIRDGTFEDTKDDEKAAHGSKSKAKRLNRLAVRLPYILMAAMKERSRVSKAVLFSSMDCVWRENPLPEIRKYLDSYDVVGAQDSHLMSMGFFMFSTRAPLLSKLLEEWAESVSKRGGLDHDEFNARLRNYSSLKQMRLPHQLFPSGTLFFEQEKYQKTALTVYVNHVSGKKAKREQLQSVELWRDLALPNLDSQNASAQAASAVAEPAEQEAFAVPVPSSNMDITIIGFTNYGMLDFALNWLAHVKDAIGQARMESLLLLYCVGEDTKDALVESGFVTRAMIRDGTVGGADFDGDHSKQGFKYDSKGFNRLAAQRPHILLAAIKERGTVSKAVLYSDMDLVWRQDPLPELYKYVNSYDVVGAQDDYLMCTGFFMFSTRAPLVSNLLWEWAQAISSGEIVNQYDFNKRLQNYTSLRQMRLPHELFPSGLLFFRQGKHQDTALTVHANYFQGQEAKREKLQSAELWRDIPIPLQNDVDMEITIIGFTNYGMLDFAFNWLAHLKGAIGHKRMESLLLLYCVGEDTKDALVESGLVTRAMIRDGTVGGANFDDVSKQGFKYESKGFNRLAAQRPHILLAAIRERWSVSKAVLYSDMDLVWRKNPLPELHKYVDSYDVTGAQDDYLVCTGFFMFSTREPMVTALLEEWAEAISSGAIVNQYDFNKRLENYTSLRQARLPHELFPSGLLFFRQKKHQDTALTVHANYFQGQDAKREQLQSAGLWHDISRSDM